MAGGVTCLLCCHNGEGRLQPTLRHLAAQRVPDALPWEVLLVDNGSTDRTADAARALWSGTAPLRVVREPRIGLTNARLRGLAEAAYEVVSFIDDDNWVCPDWVATAAAVMAADESLGLCGGPSRPSFESPPPPWFAANQGSYAVGPQFHRRGDVTVDRGWLWGAGLTVRRSAWQSLVNLGFEPALVGRQGGQLTSGEDNELCCALKLAGWRMWYEPRLTLTHFLPASRLSWSYLRRLYRGFGIASVVLDAYAFCINQRRRELASLRRTWQWQLLAAMRGLAGLVARVRLCPEGDPLVLSWERLLGRLVGLSAERGAYDQRIHRIGAAPWRDSASISRRAATH